jgi:peptide deformylase
MARRKVLLYPDKQLRATARPVERFDDDLHRLLDDLAETMYAEPGVGLAAPQVGVPLRAFVIDLTSPDGGQLREFVNPRIVEAKDEIVWKEGCLSFPGVSEEVTRSKAIVVEAFDRRGAPFRTEAAELLAVAIQHECDHLDGRLLIDRLSFLKKKLVRRRMAQVNRERAEAEAEQTAARGAR